MISEGVNCHDQRYGDSAHIVRFLPELLRGGAPRSKIARAFARPKSDTAARVEPASPECEPRPSPCGAVLCCSRPTCEPELECAQSPRCNRVLLASSRGPDGDRASDQLSMRESREPKTIDLRNEPLEELPTNLSLTGSDEAIGRELPLHSTTLERTVTLMQHIRFEPVALGVEFHPTKFGTLDQQLGTRLPDLSPELPPPLPTDCN